jgi:hypothetical protein
MNKPKITPGRVIPLVKAVSGRNWSFTVIISNKEVTPYACRSQGYAYSSAFAAKYAMRKFVKDVKGEN